MEMHDSVKRIKDRLACPRCACSLAYREDVLVCESDLCGVEYPLVSGVPVLICDEKSLFSLDDFTDRKDTTWKSNRSFLRRLVRGVLTPEISHNLRGERNLNKIVDMLSSNSNILVIGGGVRGPGIDCLDGVRQFNIVVSDVFIGPEVDVIIDAHDIPMDDKLFDLVVVQSVLEHVLDPARCVREIHRVLKDDGIVYAETPFIQQVHMKEYDFCRFTDLGHRRLFRNFEEIDRGSTGGPGMALAWSYRAFVRSFTDTPWIRSVLTIFAHWTSFFLKYFDYYLLDRAAASEGSSEFYFIGRKSTNALPDEQLISSFRGVRW